MASSKIRVGRIEKTQYRNYWKKAQEFYDTMEEALHRKKWNATALNAIHSAISANDALLVCFHGVRSTSPKHDDAIKLLLSLVKHEETKKNSSHLQKLIAMKNIVEYEDRLFFQSEALTLAKHARRFLNWVESILPRSKT